MNIKSRILIAIHFILNGTMPKWWWNELSDKFYDDEIAHDYKDGKFDYRFIRNWFISQSFKTNKQCRKHL